MFALVWLGVVAGLFGGTFLVHYGVARVRRPTAAGRLRPALLGLVGSALLVGVGLLGVGDE